MFARACADCHGGQGQGGETTGGRSAHQRTGFPGPHQRPGAAAHHHHRPARLGMPSFAGTTVGRPISSPLTSAEIDDLVALLASWRQGGPAGNQ